MGDVIEEFKALPTIARRHKKEYNVVSSASTARSFG